MLNKVQLIGNVGADPEVRTLQDGTMVATINIATSERFKDKNGEQQEKTEWHRVVLWRQLAEITDKYVKKGSQVFIEGKITTREWMTENGDKRYATDIVARELKLLGRKPTTSAIDQIAAQAQSTTQPTEQSDYAQPTETGDDLPF